MKVAVSRKIERFARVNGMSFARAASLLAKRGAAVRRSRVNRKTEAEINEERFQRMKAQRSDLY